MAVFSVAGGVDLVFGNKLGLGKEFERGLKTFGTLALSMLGMIVLAPLFAQLLLPILKPSNEKTVFDASVIIASLFANDMGGATLAIIFADTQEWGYYSGLVIGSMMGASVSFTLPFVMQAVKREQHKNMMLGLMCGVCTIPMGCIVSGLIVGLPIGELLWNLLPLLLLSALLAVGLFCFPQASVKVFRVIGKIVQVIVIVGLVIGLAEFILGKDIVPYTAPIEEGIETIFSIVAIMTGAFPLVYVLSKVLAKPLEKLGEKLGVNKTSALGFLSTIATSVTTFEQMGEMDDKGVVLNSAFAVSAAFTVADHLAFTLAFNGSYVLAVTVGKLFAGLLAVLLAVVLFYRKKPGQINKEVLQ